MHGKELCDRNGPPPGQPLRMELRPWPGVTRHPGQDGKVRARKRTAAANDAAIAELVHQHDREHGKRQVDSPIISPYPACYEAVTSYEQPPSPQGSFFSVSNEHC